MSQVAEPYIPLRAIRHLEKGRFVIFAAGNGNPYFTTDTTAALRAAEIGADAVLKGTHSGVDGVYSADPRLDPDAVKLEQVTHLEVIQRGLQVMDSTAITFCMDNSLPIIVFDVMQPGNISRALVGDAIGTLVSTARETQLMHPKVDEAHGEDAQGRRAHAGGVRRHPHRSGNAGDRREAARSTTTGRRPAPTARELLGSRAARARDLGLRQGRGQGDREGDPGERHRRHAIQRRRAHPARRSPSSPPTAASSS